MKTKDAEYAERLVALQTPWWKRVLDVQWPYRLHARLGRTLGRVPVDRSVRTGGP